MASSGCSNRFEVGSAKVLSFIKEISDANDDDGMLLFEQTDDKLVWFVVTVSHAPSCIFFKSKAHIRNSRECNRSWSVNQ